MIEAFTFWVLMSAGFGQPNGGIIIKSYPTRAECEAARPDDLITPRMRLEYTCVPGEIAWKWSGG